MIIPVRLHRVSLRCPPVPGPELGRLQMLTDVDSSDRNLIGLEQPHECIQTVIYELRLGYTQAFDVTSLRWRGEIALGAASSGVRYVLAQ
jgi:hypothetical protein